ncbi:MAG TPA: hypothetical protein PKC91_15060 [Ignavibacteria bacterium]|nr:hypothetical protein [Ignavibacteria bacterium]
MLKSSLLEILRTFSKEELMKFEDFILSPYFNKIKNVNKLFLHINKYAPEFSNENLGKEKVWRNLFPGKDYNYGIMKNLIHELNKLSIKFIEMENYNQLKYESNVNVIQQFKSRGLLNLFDKKIRESKDQLENSVSDSDSFYYNYILELFEIHVLSLRHDIKEVRNYDFNLYNMNLIRYFYTMFFDTNSIFCQISFLYNKPLDREKIDPVVRSYELSPYRNFIVDSQYYAFKIVYDPFCDENYYKLKELFYDHFDKYSARDKYMFAIALLNFCKNNSYTGNSFYIKERYQYNKLIADKELFFFDNIVFIDRYLFMSIVIAGCTAGEFEWCGKFIKKYEKNLEEKNREQTMNFAYTHLNFKSKNYEKALSYLSNCSNAAGMDKINIKVYEFFLYYELGYHEELINLADTSRHFVKHDKTISGEGKRLFSNFVNIIRRLSEYRYGLKNNSKHKYEIEDIKNFISKNQISNKYWLNQKISELEESNENQKIDI